MSNRWVLRPCRLARMSQRYRVVRPLVMFNKSDCRGLMPVSWLALWAPALLSGCQLAFGSYEFADSSSGGGSTSITGTGGTGGQVNCDEATYMCDANDVLMQCVGKQWILKTDCAAQQMQCNQPAGACTCKKSQKICVPVTGGGQELRICADDLRSFRKLDTCTGGKICFKDALVDSCVYCVVPNKRCATTATGGQVALRCDGTTGNWSDAEHGESCTDCISVNGYDDYCGCNPATFVPSCQACSTDGTCFRAYTCDSTNHKVNTQNCKQCDSAGRTCLIL